MSFNKQPPLLGHSLSPPLLSTLTRPHGQNIFFISSSHRFCCKPEVLAAPHHARADAAHRSPGRYYRGAAVRECPCFSGSCGCSPLLCLRSAFCTSVPSQCVLHAVCVPITSTLPPLRLLYACPFSVQYACQSRMEMLCTDQWQTR